MKLTKSIVNKLLSINTRNRPYSHCRAEAIAREMTKGRFYPNNGQSIVVNSSWTRLLDGQTRLNAIRMAGYPVYDINIVEVPDDQEEEVFRTIDVVHGNRSMAQILGIEGVKNATTVCAIARLVIQFNKCRTNMSGAEIQQFLNNYCYTIDQMGITRSVLTVRPRAWFWAGYFNSLIVAENPDSVHEIAGRVLDNDPMNTAENSLVAKIVGRCGMKDFQLIVATMKVLLGKSTKMIRVNENESFDDWRVNIEED